MAELTFKAAERLMDHLIAEIQRRCWRGPVTVYLVNARSVEYGRYGSGNPSAIDFERARDKALAALVGQGDTIDAGTSETATPHPGGVLLRAADGTIVGAVGVYCQDNRLDHKLASSRPRGWRL